MVPSTRLAWDRCMGLPLITQTKEYIVVLVNGIAKLVKLLEET